MRNVWIICSKELRSYFVSPIGYFLLVMFCRYFRVLLLDRFVLRHASDHAGSDGG